MIVTAFKGDWTQWTISHETSKNFAQNSPQFWLGKRGETTDFQEIQSTVFKCFVQELEKPNLKLQFDFFWKAQFLKEGKIFESQASNIKTSL